MVNPFLAHVTEALREIAALLSLRLLPFAVYGTCVSRSIPLRLIVGGTYLLLPALACRLGARLTVELIGLGSIYYLVASLGIYWLGVLMAHGHMTRTATFVILFLALLLLPGAVLPGVAILTFLIVGWELLLSGYSYCVETSRAGVRQPTLRECLFFLLVNPTLVYTASGGSVRPGQGNSRGLARAGAGAVLMFVNAALLRSLAFAVRDSTAIRGLPAGTPLAFLLYGIARFLTFYFACAGLADIHIGLMRQTGWIIPERYRFPLAAKSPMDFWRRWNTYVRMWLEAYVFLPTARHLVRRSSGMGPAGAAMITLIISGLLHDAYVFAGRQTFGGLKGTQIFVGACALLGVWRLARMLSGSIGRHLDASHRKGFELIVRVLARANMLAAVASAAIVWG
jgi:MBOAT, membrane-bound O-acyltransferase family